MKSNLTLRLKMICVILVVAFILASCTNAAPTEAEPEIPESISATESSANETTTETTVEETNIEDMFTVETEPWSNPFYDLMISDMDKYNLIIQDSLSGCGGNIMVFFGFDNEYSVSVLRDYIYEFTGEYDDNATLADVAFLQGTQRMSEIYSQPYKFSEAFSVDNWVSPYTLAYVRAYLQVNGLRFGIDEIPYDFFVERFPGFMEYIVEIEDLPMTQQQDPNDPSLEEIADPLAFNNAYDYDYAFFNALGIYNEVRMCYMYNNPYGSINNYADDIKQVKDANTGRNVLVPTEEQYYQMMEDITSIPGCENLDIAVVESKENFYESYGYYPEDILNNPMIWEGNITE